MRRAACALLVCLCLAPARAADPDVRSLLEGGHWKQARALLEPRVNANPSDAEAAAALSRVRAVYGDMDAALRLAETAVQMKPDVAEYHWQLAQVVGDQAQKANIFRQIGLARRFRQETETAIKLDPTHIEARLGMISFFVKAPSIMGGDRKKADEMAEEIARIDAAAGYLARAQVLSETNSTGDFETLYRKAAEAARSADMKYEATLSLMTWYSSQKPPRYDAAEQQAHALLKIDPHRAAGYRALGVLYVIGSRWPELDAVLVEAEKAVPDNLSPYYRAATVIIQQGSDYARADRYLRKYLMQEPEPGGATLAHAHWRLGLALEKEGKRADAIAEIEQATKLKPDLEDAKKDLRRLKSS